MSFDPYQLPEEGTLRFKLKRFRWLISGMFPETSEGDLWQAVIAQAVEDAASYKEGQLNDYHAVEAKEYLQQPVIPACAICGVDSNFLRRIIQRVGLEI